MGYSEDFRLKVMEYLDAGHSQRQTRTTFHISMTAINSWRQKYKKRGNEKDNPRQRKAKKLEAAKLKVYMGSHPYDLLSDYRTEDHSLGLHNSVLPRSF